MWKSGSKRPALQQEEGAVRPALQSQLKEEKAGKAPHSQILPSGATSSCKSQRASYTVPDSHTHWGSEAPDYESHDHLSHHRSTRGSRECPLGAAATLFKEARVPLPRHINPVSYNSCPRSSDTVLASLDTHTCDTCVHIKIKINLKRKTALAPLAAASETLGCRKGRKCAEPQSARRPANTGE